MFYSIGEMAGRLGLSTSTLRYYDKEGLLPFVERSEGGIRLFKDSDYEFLKVIQCLKATGMQLKDVKEFIHLAMQGNQTIQARLELFIRQKAEVERQMAELKSTLEMVNYKCWYYQTAKNAGTTEFPENMSDEELPEEMRAVRARLRT